MVYDHNTFMPGDGSLQEWLNSKQAPQESEYVHYYVGVDLGKKRDPSTLAVIEARWSYGNPIFLVVYLKRFRLSMYYTDIAKQLAKADVQLKQIAAKRGKTAIILYALDATGLGGPICELVQKSFEDAHIDADIRKVYITGGISITTAPEDPYEYHIPKGQLISGLMAAFDSKILKISRQSREIDAVVDELTNFEIHISEATGRDSYNAAPSKHDDLVIALALAVAFADLDGDSSGPMIW